VISVTVNGAPSLRSPESTKPSKGHGIGGAVTFFVALVLGGSIG